MTPTFLSKWFRKTPDEELAVAVRCAAHAYNDAVMAAVKAGLVVSAVARRVNGQSEEYMSDRIITIRGIYRHTTKEI